MLIKILLSLSGLILSAFAYLLNWPVFSLFFGLIYLIVVSGLWGNRFKNQGPISQLIIGLTAILAFISLTGAIAFYLNWFNHLTLFIIISLLPWLGQTKISFAQLKFNRLSTKHTWLISAYISGLFVSFVLLWQFRTAEAWRSPWLVIPAWWWFVYLGLCLLATQISKRLNSLWLIPFYWLSLSILPIIFPLGYAFDPFIHQASAKLLQLTGTISPKPFYYIGQYSLEVILSDFLKISLNKIDLWLVPLLAGLSWPVLINGLKNKLNLTNSYLSLVPVILTLPWFIISTPLALSYLWFILTVFLLWSDYQYKNQLSYLFAFASLVTHPIVGLPLLGLVIWRHLLMVHKIGRILSGTWLSLSVPAAFWFLNLINPQLLNITLNNPLPALRDLFFLIIHNLPQLTYAVHLQDALYLWGRPLTLVFLSLGLIGLLISRQYNWDIKNSIWPALYLSISFLIIKLFFNFGGLPSNEQNFYNLRLWHLSLLMLWPLVLIGADWLINFIQNKLSLKQSLILPITLLTAAGCYLTYPRFDLYQKDTAYPTTPKDVVTVRLIDSINQKQPYVVLSNQAVAAAALQEFSFSNYYQGYYFYPLPTGTNPLYQVYLKASQYYQPDRSIIKEAAELTKVKNVYLVLNRYWADFDKLTAVAQQAADQSWLIDNGSIALFRYDFNAE